MSSQAPRGDVELLPPLTWEGLADGEVHRLKRDKHFRGGARQLKDVAQQQAALLGRACRALPDELGRNQYLWVQFADFQIPLGAPCPRCGGLRQQREHVAFGRCLTCGATLTFRGSVDDAPRRGRRRARSVDLGWFSDVRLRRVERVPGREEYAGTGTGRKQVRHLLFVSFLLDDEGERIPDPLDPGVDLYDLQHVPVEPFADLVADEQLDRFAASVDVDEVLRRPG